MEETLSLDDAMWFFSPRRNGVFSIFSIEGKHDGKGRLWRKP
jgi:hypothetical protein